MLLGQELLIKGFYLSVDLEDFTFDINRSVGNNDVVNEDALWFSYRVINNFCKNNLGKQKITFFTTGAVARTVPSLLKTIHDEGHEVSSHYDFHDLMADQKISVVEKNLESAITSIEDATGVKPKGFRAPAFSIPESRYDIYSLLSRYFEYDSSLVLKSERIKSGEYKKMDIFTNDNFKEFPIIPKPYLFDNLHIKSGGTYMRLFSAQTIKSVMDFNLDEGFTPLVYMHPYDYLYDKEFWVEYDQFSNLPFLKRINKYLRQNQWLGFGNKKTLDKIKSILKDYKHIGRMGYES